MLTKTAHKTFVAHKKFPLLLCSVLMLVSATVTAQAAQSSPTANAANVHSVKESPVAESPVVEPPMVEPPVEKTATGSPASNSAASNIPTTDTPATNAPQSASVDAKSGTGISSATKPNSAAQLANLLGGLALILVLIFGLSWFVKRFSQGGFLQNPAIKMVASMPLGTRERLMLIELGGKQILLGVTATQITNLQTFDHPVVTAGDKEAGSDFSQKLMAILQQKNISQSGGSSPRDHQA